MSSSTSRSASSLLAGVHLIGALVAVERRRRADRVAERPVEGRGIFRRIGHDLHVEEARGVEPCADRADAAVHHVGGRDDVAAGSAWISACCTSTVDRLIVEDHAVAHQPVMAVAGIGIERDVGSMTPSSGTSRLIARQARQTRLSALSASLPSLVARPGRYRGRARCRECRAWPPARPRAPPRRRDSRSTPGIDATGSRALVAVDEEERPDQVVGGQHILGAPAGAPIRPCGCGAGGWRGRDGCWRRGRLDRSASVRWGGALPVMGGIWLPRGSASVYLSAEAG